MKTIIFPIMPVIPERRRIYGRWLMRLAGIGLIIMVADSGKIRICGDITMPRVAKMVPAGAVTGFYHGGD
jgi:hypothetical protein